MINRSNKSRLVPAPPDKTILVVDDAPSNTHLLVERLRAEYRVVLATGGEQALELVSTGPVPDLILLDVVMPGLDGYAVCRRLKADAATRHLPIIFMTALGETEDEAQGLALGAADYLTKPISPPIALARIGTLLAAAELARERQHMVARLEAQAAELSDLTRTFEQRVAEGVGQLTRLSRLKRYFSPSVVDLMLSGAVDDPLKSHSREIAAAFVDLRDFTAFTEAFDPEVVMHVLHEYHEAMGRIIMAHGGTLEHFAGDGMMIYFNDPIEIDNPAAVAVKMAIAMQERFATLVQGWEHNGYAIALGIGVSLGHATIGAIGFEGRRDYGVIGNVTNLASRLCGHASGGQILISQRVLACVADFAKAELIGELHFKGFRKPTVTYAVRGYIDGLLEAG